MTFAGIVQLRAELNQALEDSSQQRDQIGRFEEELRQSELKSSDLESTVAELNSRTAHLQV